MKLRYPIVFAAIASIAASTAAVAGGSYSSNKRTGDIVEVAVAAGQFTTLAQALTAAGLVDTLKGAGPFTVFAPTDAAFAKLPPGTLASLLEPANRDQLVAVLTYHVVPGKVTASDVVKLDSAQTVNGDNIDVRVDGQTVRIDGATVVSADIPASNGVIHVIDQVILPGSGS
jgi:uncharacterized surface protein with fasciclin (FAS1) repeats